MSSDRRECGVCWWVYDPEVGDDDAQIPPGVAFEDLPSEYACPRCQAPKERFLRPTQDLVGALVHAYRAVDERMRGLPIHNERLSVEAVGFRKHDEWIVGALVTPWFVNLVVFGHALPREGDSVVLAFPGGRFAAMGASPEGVAHLAVPLLSPVHELADQGAARVLAAESLRLILTPEPAARDAEHAPAAPATATAAAPRAVGRRGLLGGLLGG